MTRARWLTGGLIAAGALVVAGEALATYVSGHLVVGIVAVLVLMGVLVVGLVSLARARLYIERELAAMRAAPPGGALFLARRRQMTELRGRDVAPDLDVLADATAADEAERAYAGKYLVATTVLIGLVGTFGGLMETLARVAPLLKGELATGGAAGAGALGLIAGPLAGLHVTFGTSVVAILVTLALALIQGDVTLRHEQLLALLQERTRHVLIPELWPAEQSAAERTVRALVELRGFVAETLTAGAEASAAKIAAVVRVEIARLVEGVGGELRGATAAQTAALERTNAAMTDLLRETTTVAAKELRDAAATSRDAMTAAATASRETMTAAATASRETIAAAATATGDLMAVAAAALTAALGESDAKARAEAERVVRAVEAAAATSAKDSAALVERAAMAVDRAVAALSDATARTSEAFTSSTTAAVAALAELRVSEGARLEAASQALTAAASDLRGTVETLSPPLAALTPQLGALAAEIALLAARSDSPEPSNAVLEELVRLGEDVERLVTAGQPQALAAGTADS